MWLIILFQVAEKIHKYIMFTKSWFLTTKILKEPNMKQKFYGSIFFVLFWQIVPLACKIEPDQCFSPKHWPYPTLTTVLRNLGSMYYLLSNCSFPILKANSSVMLCNFWHLTLFCCILVLWWHISNNKGTKRVWEESFQ